jgi:hypothetical protein
MKRCGGRGLKSLPRLLGGFQIRLAGRLIGRPARKRLGMDLHLDRAYCPGSSPRCELLLDLVHQRVGQSCLPQFSKIFKDNSLPRLPVVP